jgi:hypothetical protein
MERACHTALVIFRGRNYENFHIVARTWRLCKTGFGLTAGFIGLHAITVTMYTLYNPLHFTVFTRLQLSTAHSELLFLCHSATTRLEY